MTEKQKSVHTALCQRGFLPAGAENYQKFKDFQADNLLYEMSVSLTVTWSGIFNTLYRIIDGFFCTVCFYRDGEISFCVRRPKAPHDLRHIVDTLYNLSAEAGLSSLLIWAVEERFLPEYRNIEGYDMKADYSDTMSEYVYTTADLLELRGEVNYYKRKRLKEFLNKPNVSVRDITKENVRVCLDIEDVWCGCQDCPLCESFAGCSKKTLKIMTEIFDGTRYQGILCDVDGVPAGYAIWEKASDNLAYMHFAKAGIPNLNTYLYYIVTQNYLSSVTQINNGADLGKQGLRIFKKGLGKHTLWRKYLCEFTAKKG
ncbi:hypothetical protein AGMMS4952_02730 [Spirochaetia bacterium]|nr:hypothetical protein AGMMS4952_02730 [Spirochaetia bacterium]